MKSESRNNKSMPLSLNVLRENYIVFNCKAFAKFDVINRLKVNISIFRKQKVHLGLLMPFKIILDEHHNL